MLPRFDSLNLVLCSYSNGTGIVGLGAIGFSGGIAPDVPRSLRQITTLTHRRFPTAFTPAIPAGKTSVNAFVDTEYAGVPADPPGTASDRRIASAVKHRKSNPLAANTTKNRVTGSTAAPVLQVTPSPTLGTPLKLLVMVLSFKVRCQNLEISFIC
jgi:hypothetical protein